MRAARCALRADGRGRVGLPDGFLHGIRLASHAAWLRCTGRQHGSLHAQILDAAILHQAPGRQERARAAHWALHPTPLAAPHGAPPSMQLAALALAVHTRNTEACADLDDLTRLTATAPSSLEDLLDQLIRARTLNAWRHDNETGKICWQLPPAHG